jgi:DNA-binding SARP family transcriptional activator
MEFRVLGPLEVSEPRGESRWTEAERRARPVLLHANEVASVDPTADELWGADLPRSGPTSLQNYISRLRKVLGPDVFVRRGSGLRARDRP